MELIRVGEDGWVSDSTLSRALKILSVLLSYLFLCCYKDFCPDLLYLVMSCLVGFHESFVFPGKKNEEESVWGRVEVERCLGKETEGGMCGMKEK